MIKDLEHGGQHVVVARSNVRTPRLRPGAEVLEVSEDCLHIAFANHTATFNSPLVVRTVKTLIAGMSGGRVEEDLIASTAADTSMDAGLVRYVLEMLIGTQCLYWSEGEAPVSSLEEFWGSIGDDPAVARTLLSAVRPVVVATQRAAVMLEEALEAAGIAAAVTALAAGDSTDRIAAAVNAHEGTPSLILAWDLSYRSAAARAVNDLAMRGSPVLFGSCEGLVGRVGPYVLPGCTPCLACLNSRLLSNAAPEEAACATALRAHSAEQIGRPSPTHPVFLKSMTGLFVLEASEILMKRPARTLGGLLQYSLADSEVRRRAILRAPRCSACGIARPPRFAWSANLASPEVKAGSHEG